jgi:hypothetical protein
MPASPSAISAIARWATFPATVATTRGRGASGSSATVPSAVANSSRRRRPSVFGQPRVASSRMAMSAGAGERGGNTSKVAAARSKASVSVGASTTTQRCVASANVAVATGLAGAGPLLVKVTGEAAHPVAARANASRTPTVRQNIPVRWPRRRRGGANPGSIQFAGRCRTQRLRSIGPLRVHVGVSAVLVSRLTSRAVPPLAGMTKTWPPPM